MVVYSNYSIAIYMKTETIWKRKRKKNKITGFTTNIFYYHKASIVSYYANLYWNSFTSMDIYYYLLNNPFCSLYTWKNKDRAYSSLFQALEDWSLSFLYKIMSSLSST